MKRRTEMEVLQTALKRKTEPNHVLATAYIDLPDGKSQAFLYFYRDRAWRQITATLHDSTHFDFQQPSTLRYSLIVPEIWFRKIKRELREIGVHHLLGIESEDRIDRGSPLVAV